MKICVPVRPDGQIDPRWGRAENVALADVVAGEIHDWQEVNVAWATLHDEGSEGAHHARVARFLQDHGVQTVAVNHLGPGMQNMLERMGIRVITDLSGDAREAVALLA